MSIKQAAWTHGAGVQLETPSWYALRQGFGTTVRPSPNSTFGWVHLVIPTPVISDGVRLNAESALIRFATGSDATITSLHVYDGEKKIVDANGLSLKGGLQTYRQAVPGRPDVLWGTVICLGVTFNGWGENAWVSFVSAGIDFYRRHRRRNIHLKSKNNLASHVLD
ncbi:hypothetical protein BDD12DRAFT_988203 [Trichophaea hybrida]|nr:hypothetical protein BDD12DRAFT_988203 [Trichophaea hybrida]